MQNADKTNNRMHNQQDIASDVPSAHDEQASASRSTEEESSNAVCVDDEMLKRLRRAENRGLIRTYARMQATESQMVLIGEIELPLLDMNDVTLSFSLTSDENNQSREIMIEAPVRKLPPEHATATLAWRTAIEWDRLSKHGDLQVGDCFWGSLIVSRLGMHASVDVLIDVSHSNYDLMFAKGLADGLAFGFGAQAGQPLLTVGDYQAQREEPMSYRMESLAWVDDQLVGKLMLHHPLANANILEAALSLELQDATQDAGPLPISLSTAYEAPGVRRCAFTFEPASLIPVRIAGDARLRYTLTLAYHWAGQLSGKRLDVFVSDDDVDTHAVEMHPVISQNRFIQPLVAGQTPFVFEVETIAHALADPVQLRVEDLAWTEGVLGMYGSVRQRMMNLDGYQCTLMLVHGSGAKRRIPWTLTLDDEADLRTRSWKTAFRASVLLAGLKSGTWQFCLEKKFGPISAIESFGLKRHDGLMEKFVQKLIRTGNEYWLPVDIGGGSIGFRTIDAGSVSHTAHPQITHMEWTGDHKLSITGKARHPLTAIGGLQCGLMLQSVSSGSVEIPVRTTVADDGTITWQGDFEPAALLEGKREGLWYLTFSKRFDTQFDSEIPANAMDDEVFKQASNHYLGATVRMVEGAGGAIGFRVSESGTPRPKALSDKKRRWFRRR